MAVRILIADDHKIVRDGLKALLESETDFEVIGEAGTGLEATMVTPPTGPIDGQPTPTGMGRTLQESRNLFTGPKLAAVAGVLILIVAGIYFGYSTMQAQKLENYIAVASSHYEKREFGRALKEVGFGIRDFPQDKQLEGLEKKIEGALKKEKAR